MQVDAEFLYVLFGLLISLLAWIGQRVHTKLDSLGTKIEEKLGEVNKTLGSIEKDLRADLQEHEKRLTILETEFTIRGINSGTTVTKKG